MLYVITVEFTLNVLWAIPSDIIEPLRGKENNP